MEPVHKKDLFIKRNLFIKRICTIKRILFNSKESVQFTGTLIVRFTVTPEGRHVISDAR